MKKKETKKPKFNGRQTFRIDEDRDIWDIQPGEPLRIWNYFLRYCKMGTERSLKKISDIVFAGVGNPDTNLTRIKKLSTKYHWVERAIEYDRHLAEMDRKELEAQRRYIKKRDFEQTEKLRDIVDKILNIADEFVTRKEVFVPGKNGEPDMVIVNQRLDAEVAIKGLELASKVQRLIVGETTEEVRITNTAIDAMLKRELEKMLQGEAEEEDGEDEEEETEDDDFTDLPDLENE